MANEIQAQIQKKQLSAEKRVELNSSDHGEITQKRQPPVDEKIERRSIEPKKKEESPVVPSQDKKDDKKPIVKPASVQKQEQKQVKQALILNILIYYFMHSTECLLEDSKIDILSNLHYLISNFIAYLKIVEPSI